MAYESGNGNRPRKHDKLATWSNEKYIDCVSCSKTRRPVLLSSPTRYCIEVINLSLNEDLQ